MTADGQRKNPDSGPEKATLQPGSFLSHYEIIRLISTGRMGEVYLAHDSVLDRRVAIKLLPAWLSKNPRTKNDILSEARITSRLNHPNIVTVHSVEESDNRLFMVNEFVAGRSLKEVMDAGRLDTRQAVNIALEICDGLAAAGESGIVHRDIKPENILITDNGHVKICDFGLAVLKDLPESATAGPTSGTLAYMSPEQTKGEVLDPRSDLFSLGVVIYEMLAGELPFKGKYEAALIFAIRNETPRPLAELESEIPFKLQDIVTKLLEKNRADRYENASEVKNDLLSIFESGRDVLKKRMPGKIIAGIVITAIVAIFSLFLYYIFDNSREMVAVLPLKNLGPEEEDKIVDGLTGAIITDLTKGGEIGVISYTTVMRYRDMDKSLPQIGRELGAEYLLEGTVLWDTRRKPENVRLTTRLVKASIDSVLWAERYEGNLDRIFQIISDIANRIKIKVVRDYSVRVYEPELNPTDSLDAYAFYLQGYYYFSRSWDEQDVRFAINMYKKAIEIDSSFSLAYAWLSRANSVMYWEYYDRSEYRLALARETALKSLRFNRNLPEGHLALGIYFYSILEFDKALFEFREAEKYQPDNSELLTAIAGVKRRQGEFDKALEFYLKALKFDPLSHLKMFDVALTLSMLRRYSDAERYLDNISSIAPDWPLPYIYKAWLYIFWTGDRHKAGETLAKARGVADLSESEYYEYYWWLLRVVSDNYADVLKKINPVPDSTSYYLHKARLFRLLGDSDMATAYYDSAKTMLETIITRNPADPMYLSRLGLACAGLGLKKQAIDDGENAVNILPVTRDAYNGQFIEANLAEIYVMTGEYDKAVARLEHLLSIPGFTSVPYLRDDPIWKPLMADRRFVGLISD